MIKRLGCGSDESAGFLAMQMHMTGIFCCVTNDITMNGFEFNGETKLVQRRASYEDFGSSIELQKCCKVYIC